MFRKIVVGLDGSATSETALRLACDLAQKYDSEIHLVHTPQPQTVGSAMGAFADYHTAPTTLSDAKIKEAAEKIVNSGKAIAKEYNLTITQTHMELGNPADEIIVYAEVCAADLIVTGRRSLSSIGSRLLGSTSKRVNDLANCACLTVV